MARTMLTSGAARKKKRRTPKENLHALIDTVMKFGGDPAHVDAAHWQLRGSGNHCYVNPNGPKRKFRTLQDAARFIVNGEARITTDVDASRAQVAPP
jgi:hypothetical protein